MMLKVGDPAPDFELLSAEEEPVRLSDLQGERVILFFYPKADTPGCTRQASGFRDNLPRIEAAGATVLGISPDPPAALAAWQEKLDLPYRLLSDSEHEVAEAYGVWGEKQYGDRTYTGVIRSHFVVDEEGHLADVQVDVSPEDSVQRALACL